MGKDKTEIPKALRFYVKDVDLDILDPRIDADPKRWEQRREGNIAGCKKHLTRWQIEAKTLREMAYDKYFKMMWSLRSDGLAFVVEGRDSSEWFNEESKGLQIDYFRQLLDYKEELEFSPESDGKRYEQINVVYEDVCRLRLLKKELEEFITQTDKDLTKLKRSKAADKLFMKEAFLQAEKELDEHRQRMIDDENEAFAAAAAASDDSSDVEGLANAMDTTSIASEDRATTTHEGDEVSEGQKGKSGRKTTTPSATATGTPITGAQRQTQAPNTEPTLLTRNRSSFSSPPTATRQPLQSTTISSQ